MTPYKGLQGAILEGLFHLEKLKALIPADDAFKAIGMEWFAKESPYWSDTHRIRENRNLEKDLFPWIGNRRADDIEALELLATVRRVEARGALDMAHRVLGTARQVLSYAVATGRARANVAREIGIALKPPCYGDASVSPCIVDSIPVSKLK